MTRHLIRLDAADDFDGWRSAARSLAAAEVPADQILWQVGDQPADLFAPAPRPLPTPTRALTVPKGFLPLARSALLHRDPERFALLYALLLRVARQPGLLHDKTDPLRRRIDALAQTVHRDMHKMHAFLRFREMSTDTGPRYVAWFEPDHHITRANAGFFVGRFATMHWSILTPDTSLHWDTETLRQGPGASVQDAAPGDPLEEVWKAYYAAIFNPARLNPKAMLSEMPKKYWKNLPEAALIPDLIAGARAREIEMIDRSRNAALAPRR